MTTDINAWVAALQTRHRGAFTNSEFLKAVRALSARYVERRNELPDRSPLDSAAKRAAFAAFYAPLHLLTATHVVRALKAGDRATGTLIDLGCGTGVAAAGWAAAMNAPMPLRIIGVDQHAWTLDEAAWTWRTLGLDGRTKRGDMLRAPLGDANAVVLGWSVNELPQTSRPQMLTRLLDHAKTGRSILVIEPIGNRATPWWPEWAEAFTRRGGQGNEWRFHDPLPPLLAELDEAAGFRRDGLSAKSLWLSS